MIIAEKGCRAVYSARKKTTNASRARQVEAILYRESCIGRIVAAHHDNLRLFGARRFTLLPKHNYRRVVEKERTSEIKTVKDRNKVFSSSSILGRGLLYRTGHHSATSAACIKLENTLQQLKHFAIFQSEDPVWLLLPEFCFTSRPAANFVHVVTRNFEANIYICNL